MKKILAKTKVYNIIFNLSKLWTLITVKKTHTEVVVEAVEVAEEAEVVAEEEATMIEMVTEEVIEAVASGVEEAAVEAEVDL